MIFSQLFDSVSYARSYLIPRRPEGEAFRIDPIMENVDRHLKLLRRLDFTLLKAVHANQITWLGELRYCTSCITVVGMAADVNVV